jgi:chemotaxis protein CheX
MAAESLTLPETLDLTAAAPLRSEILSRRGQPLDLDGSAVQRLGGLCLQVLLAARSAWTDDGHTLRFVAPSPALKEAFTIMGADLAMASCFEETSA